MKQENDSEQCVAFHVVIVDRVVSEGMNAEIKYMTEVLRKGNAVPHKSGRTENHGR